jgi:integral membrane protein (TIGR01906 family)
MTPSKAQGLARTILTLCVPIILIAAPLYLLWRPAYLRFQYSRPSFPASVRFDDAERLRLSTTILRYTVGDATREEMASMPTDEGETALLPAETQHLVDVGVVVQGIYTVGAVALVLAVMSGIYLTRTSPSRLVKALRAGTVAILGFLLVVGLAALVDFDRFFTLLHGVFFEPGTWTFYYEDTLIQLYPLPFWTTAIMHLLILMAVLAAVALAIAQIVSQHARSRASQ